MKRQFGNSSMGAILGVFLLFCAATVQAAVVEVNDDGQALIAQGAQAYAEEMRDRPVLTDKAYLSYLQQVVKKLQGGDKPPAGVVPRITVINAPAPQLYSYTDGNIVITTAAVLSADNEAQLAALMAHEMAHLMGGHYILLYQKIKAAERKQRFLATAGAIFGAVLDSAVDYAAEVESAKQVDRVMKGEETYLSAMKSQAKIGAAQSAYYGVKEAIANIPEKDEKGDRIDPRQRFEVVADIQAMVILAKAGYDPSQASGAWKNVRDLTSSRIVEKEQGLGDMAEQLKQIQAMMRMMQQQMQQSLGKSGLSRTIADTPPSRPDLVAGYEGLKEVREALKGGHGKKGVEPYQAFIRKILLPRAERLMEDERYQQAEADYRNLYRKGFKEAPVLYGVAKCALGDFAFAATEGQKKEAEKLYIEATKKDRKYAAPWKALGELYEDWERYEDAMAAYQGYLKAAPSARDRKKIKRKIKSLKRKAEL
ncbi:MAG: M48 family metalloprotease [Desulfobacteraceae bacterium]